jgi:Fe-S cluster assembly protein SufD
VTQAYAEARKDQGNDSSGLAQLRREALARFAATGYPTSKDEEWRFTPIAPIANTHWEPASELARGSATPESIDSFLINRDDWTTLVFVNGRFDLTLSHRPRPIAGLSVETLAEALIADPGLLRTTTATPFALLNSASAEDGAVIRVAAGVEVADPIQFLYVTTPEAAGCTVHVRNVLSVAQGARIQFIESYAGVAPGASFTNAVTEVSVGNGAWVEHSRIQRESETTYHIGLTEVEQGRDSHYRSFTLAMGGAIARHDLRVRLCDENVETLLYGLYLGRGAQLIDNHTAIFHDHPNCRSWEVYKGILDDNSRAVFNGKVFVKPEAQKTDAKQTNRNLLLSTGAKVNTKPQLEIFADDVKCTHGATVGRIDEAAFFYLQSRGIPRAEARRLLIYAFAAEVVSEVASAPVREALDRLVLERLR